MKHLKIEVIGRVQGVSFRYYTREEAQRLGVKGFVKNCADGSVYIEAEGNETTLEQFVQWCHKGSPFSQVNRVIVKEEALSQFQSFEIRSDWD